jgi:hypothetical protein
MIDRWEMRFKRICNFGWIALAGLPFVALAVFTDGFIRIFGITTALFLIVPGFVYITFLSSCIGRIATKAGTAICGVCSS